MKLYVASSWRCEKQPQIVALLRAAGHEVYDFRHPLPGKHGFAWSEIDRKWQHWDRFDCRGALQHPVALSGFASDFDAMKWANACVLVLPCGRSAHLEAGYFVGAGKPLYILILEDCEPELMYKMATAICLTLTELEETLEASHG